MLTFRGILIMLLCRHQTCTLILLDYTGNQQRIGKHTVLLTWRSELNLKFLLCLLILVDSN